MKAVVFPLSLLLIGGCGGQKETATAPDAPAAGGAQLSTAQGAAATGHLVVYRTAADLKDKVPVTLSKDGMAIVAYPHPKDLRTADGLATPVELANGWLLDRRGIGKHSAFLRITYAEYAALDTPPALADLNEGILDRDPFTDLCDCGPRSAFADPAVELARIIRNDSLDLRCKRLK